MSGRHRLIRRRLGRCGSNRLDYPGDSRPGTIAAAVLGATAGVIGVVVVSGRLLLPIITTAPGDRVVGPLVQSVVIGDGDYVTGIADIARVSTVSDTTALAGNHNACHPGRIRLPRTQHRWATSDRIPFFRNDIRYR
jgi:hypothetical protein